MELKMSGDDGSYIHMRGIELEWEATYTYEGGDEGSYIQRWSNWNEKIRTTYEGKRDGRGWNWNDKRVNVENSKME